MYYRREKGESGEEKREKRCVVKFLEKYVGVQSWKALHLPTLDIRVKQKGNRALKWEIHVGFL